MKTNPEELLRERVRAVWSDLTKKKVHIEDQPLKRGYSLVGEDDKEILFLGCFDLKRMGPDIYRHFASTSRDTDAILAAIGAWAYTNN
jgi:hypothetical protein